MDTTTRTVCGVHLAHEDGHTYPLTPCCGASGKGSGTGIVCRSCYRTVPSVYGTGASTLAQVADLVTELGGCPCPDTCAVDAWHTLAIDHEEVAA